MYPIPPGEHLIETRTCKFCHGEFPITDKDMSFYEKVSPVFGGKKYLIPPPTLCPDCRQQRRLSFRNERKLYKRKCDATGKEIVSIYSPDKPYTVYHQEYWWSDAWDPMSYGKEFDFGRGVFEQMRELMGEVPRPSLLNTNIENSEYVNYSSYIKDSYLIFDATQSEQVFYGSNLEFVKNSVDMTDVSYCENCSHLLDSSNCNNVHDGWGCNWSHDCYHVEDLENAHHCFMSHTVYNKSYIFQNTECTKEEYEKRMTEFQKLPQKTQDRLIQEWKTEYRKTKIYPYHLSVKFENSTGHGLLNVKNATACYSIQEAEDIKYSSNSANLKDCYDVGSVGEGAERCYEINAAMRMHMVCFGFGTWGTDLYYSDHVSWSNNCFLCVGLRNKSYCILNKQYTREEYEELVPRIIEKMMKDGEWGEFFPASLSPFGYNETVAQEYYPLTKEEAIKDGIFNWSDYEAPFPSVSRVIDEEGMKRLPESIEDVPDDILNWALTCEVSGKPFRIIKQELEFYRKHSLPIPRRHPDVRHMDRMKMRNPRKLFERKCDKCNKDMITTYAPERPERVYCQGCYDREVVQ